MKRAYRERATAGSFVPLIMARPSAKTVISYGGTWKRRRKSLRRISDAESDLDAGSHPDADIGAGAEAIAEAVAGAEMAARAGVETDAVADVAADAVNRR